MRSDGDRGRVLDVCHGLSPLVVFNRRLRKIHPSQEHIPILRERSALRDLKISEELVVMGKISQKTFTNSLKAFKPFK